MTHKERLEEYMVLILFGLSILLGIGAVALMWKTLTQTVC